MGLSNLLSNSLRCCLNAFFKNGKIMAERKKMQSTSVCQQTVWVEIPTGFEDESLSRQGHDLINKITA